MFWILADYAHNAFPSDNLAMFAHLFD